MKTYGNITLHLAAIIAVIPVDDGHARLLLSGSGSLTVPASAGQVLEDIGRAKTEAEDEAEARQGALRDTFQAMFEEAMDRAEQIQSTSNARLDRLEGVVQDLLRAGRPPSDVRGTV